jgi:hypothetical protein
MMTARKDENNVTSLSKAAITSKIKNLACVSQVAAKRSTFAAKANGPLR